MRNDAPIIRTKIADEKGLLIAANNGFFETKKNDNTQQNAAYGEKVEHRAPTCPT